MPLIVMWCKNNSRKVFFADMFDMNGYYAVDEWFKFAYTFKAFFPLSAQKCFNISSTGNIPPSKAGVTLAHEHLLVDFIGAENYSHSRWKEDDAYLGRDAKIIAETVEGRK